MNAIAELALTVCDRNPLRTPIPVETTSWTVVKCWRGSEGYEQEPTGHEFDSYAAAETYAEGLNNSTQVWERFWFEAEEADS
jgi:hypothetical protein